MKILALYNNDCALELFQWLEREKHEVVLWTDKLDAVWCKEQAFDLTVSYTYRHILSQDLIHVLNDNVVNLHNSLLPFNRGADPNIWSIVEKTPRGVTLHYIDAEIDKGYIIAQSIVNDSDEETLETSYFNLDRAAKTLFQNAFRYYEYWPNLKKKATGTGTFHSLKDAIKIKSIIIDYSMPISEFRKCLRQMNDYQ